MVMDCNRTMALLHTMDAHSIHGTMCNFSQVSHTIYQFNPSPYNVMYSPLFLLYIVR